MLSQQIFGLAGFSGVVSHLGYFIHGEHHIEAPKIFRYYLVILGTTVLIRWYGNGDDFARATSVTSTITFGYCIGLFGSMLLYRVLFHRLGGFPGPRVAKTSKLWNVVNSLKFTNFRLMEQMHRQYGDFVRTGTVQIFEDGLKSVFMKNHLLILLVLRPKRDIDIQSGSCPCS